MTSDAVKPTRQDEAAAWFAAQRAGVMLVEQRAAFDAWRADPRNQAALDAMHDLWEDLAVLKGTEPAPRKKAAGNRYAYIAAALAVFIAGGIAAATALLPRGETTIATAAGEQTTQSMTDGSLIAVNVASHVKYAITDTARLVSLGEGEAAFTVRPDSSRPFIVKVGAYEIRAVGTAFNVRNRGAGVEVSVSEGKVQICKAAAEGEIVAFMDLGAGERVRLPDSPEDLSEQKPVQIPAAQVAEWRKRVVTYEDATVREVVEDFNRYFERKLLVTSPDLLEQRVTIRLQVDDRDRAIEVLASLLDATVVRAGNGEALARQPARNE